MYLNGKDMCERIFEIIDFYKRKRRNCHGSIRKEWKCIIYIKYTKKV